MGRTRCRAYQKQEDGANRHRLNAWHEQPDVSRFCCVADMCIAHTCPATHDCGNRLPGRSALRLTISELQWFERPEVRPKSALLNIIHHPRRGNGHERVHFSAIDPANPGPWQPLHPLDSARWCPRSMIVLSRLATTSSGLTSYTWSSARLKLINWYAATAVTRPTRTRSPTPTRLQRPFQFNARSLGWFGIPVPGPRLRMLRPDRRRLTGSLGGPCADRDSVAGSAPASNRGNRESV